MSKVRVLQVDARYTVEYLAFKLWRFSVWTSIIDDTGKPVCFDDEASAVAFAEKAKDNGKIVYVG
jgi:hypothetical protein